MTKDELIVRLRQLRSDEELAIPIYAEHLENTFFLSRFKPETRKEIEAMLLNLAMECEVHARMFDAVIGKIQDSGRDVY